jgi:hypothetical protein
MADIIEQCISDWHKQIRGEYPGGLDELLADDVVFLSPVVFTPQKGKDLTKLYLQAAAGTFGGDEDSGSISPEAGTSSGSDDEGFHYTKEVLSGNQAVLEFETKMGGKYVNGVDIITCNDAGKIIEFKVMIRPLQAVNLLHQKMGQMLEKMKDA